MPPRFAEIVRGAPGVVVVGDNDDVGIFYARHMAARFVAAGVQDVRIVAPLPDAGEHGDLSDFLEAHSAAELLAVLDAAPSYEEQAAPPQTTRTRSSRSEQRRRQNAEGPPPGRDDLLAQMNNELALLEEPVGRILFVHPELRFQVARPTDLVPRYSHIPPPDDDFSDAVRWWLAQAEKRRYNKVVFAPERDVPNCYNPWRGFAVEPEQGDCSRFWALVRDVICAGDDAKYTYVRRWLALMIQRPWERPEVALLLRSAQGSGKGTFFGYVAQLFYGDNCVEVSNVEDLFGRFNASLAQAVFVHANEAMWGGDKRHVGRMKAMITDPTTRIELKGVDAIFVDNAKHFVFSSNAEVPVPIERGDRRFALFDLSEQHRQDEAYFRAVYAEMERGGVAALLNDLLHEDLFSYSARQRPLSTIATDIVLANASPVDQWLYDCLHQALIGWERGELRGRQRKPWPKAGHRADRYEIEKDDLYQS